MLMMVMANLREDRAVEAGLGPTKIHSQHCCVVQVWRVCVKEAVGLAFSPLSQSAHFWGSL